MGKTYIDAVKYTIHAHFEVSGLVEKPDVIGAMFGQTEGLLGEDLELRDLQKNGRIGRIEVELTHSKNKTYGSIKLPSSLDVVETSIIAAALEAIDRVGPCDAKITVDKIEDNRNAKRKKILERAKELLRDIMTNQLPDSREITNIVRKELRVEEVINYGKDKLPAGPNVNISDEIILVEGRADVINLLKNDIKNVIGIGGANISQTIINLTKKKETTVFLDGDRGGDIILKELINAGADIDFVAKAATGKEVEELTRKEMIKALRNKIPVDQYIQENKYFSFKENKVKKKLKPKKEEKENENLEENNNIEKTIINKKELERAIIEVKGKFLAKLYDRKSELVKEISVKNMIKELLSRSDIGSIAFDGIITQRLVDIAENKGIKAIYGVRIGNVRKKPENIIIEAKNA